MIGRLFGGVLVYDEKEKELMGREVRNRYVALLIASALLFIEIIVQIQYDVSIAAYVFDYCGDFMEDLQRS